jgi:hypothetical protein
MLRSPLLLLCAPLAALALVGSALAGPDRSEPAAAEDMAGVLLQEVRSALPARPDVRQVELACLGFSSDGALAWMSGAEFPEMDGYSWGVVVQDLVADRQIGRVLGGPSAGVDGLQQAATSRYKELRALLVEHGIAGRPVPTGQGPLHPLPWIREPPQSDRVAYVDHGQDEVYTVEVEAIGKDVYEVRLRSSRRGLKVIGQLETLLGGPTPIGLVISPFEPRVAVVLQYASWPLHGSDAKTLDFTILGAHLETGFSPGP